MSYVSPPILGLQCGVCTTEINFNRAEDTSYWSPYTVVTCPNCQKQLRYPKQFLPLGLFVRVLATFLFLYITIRFESLLTEINTIALPFIMLVYLFLFIKSFKLSNKHIVMVEIDEKNT
jgi:hypothetical protein